jgi:hypothetical protein
MREFWFDQEPRDPDIRDHRSLRVTRFLSLEMTATRRRRRGDVKDQNIRPPGRGWRFPRETDVDKSTWWYREVGS